MDKGRHNEAVACEVERNNGSLPIKTERVCTFDMRYECKEAYNTTFRAQARSRPVVLSTLFHKSYLNERLKPTVPSLGPYEDETIAEGV